jgi:hypothetical protein
LFQSSSNNSGNNSSNHVQQPQQQAIAQPQQPPQPINGILKNSYDRDAMSRVGQRYNNQSLKDVTHWQLIEIFLTFLQIGYDRSPTTSAAAAAAATTTSNNDSDQWSSQSEFQQSQHNDGKTPPDEPVY